jgi:chromosomal replication initiator protein
MGAAPSDELEHIWSLVRSQLALVVEEPTFRLWLEPLRAVEVSDECIVVEAPKSACSWIQDRFGRVIGAAVELVLGDGVGVEIVAADGERPSAGTTAGQTAASAEEAQELPTATQPLSNPKLTFDQFVIGDCNRLAHAAALTVAEMPAQAYNPLFIYGPPGVGKTHLLNAIANLLLLHNPGLTVRATNGEAFTNEFVAALANGKAEGFKRRFRHIDVLLMDDVQFLERKTKTEEEFFHTFNALHDGGRQIVLTSDRPPADLSALEDRLRERFQAGLVADITPPEFTTRMAILRKRAHNDGIQVADEQALTAIAERVQSNVRALEGALIRTVAFSSLTGRPLTGALAQEVLDGLYPRTGAAGRSTRSVNEIQIATAKHFEISTEELLSSARAARIAWPRQVAMYLSRELTNESLPSIGRHFGGRDHTTVLHACRRASSRITDDKDSREAVEKLCRDLGCEQP